jgi:hypothetical protein
LAGVLAAQPSTVVVQTAALLNLSKHVDDRSA